MGSCQIPQVPKPPKIELYQPLIKHSKCIIYDFDDLKNEWKVKKRLELSACEGILGVTSDDYVKIEYYFKELNHFLNWNCKKE